MSDNARGFNYDNMTGVYRHPGWGREPLEADEAEAWVDDHGGITLTEPAIVPLDGALGDVVQHAVAYHIEADSVVGMAAGAGQYALGDRLHEACCDHRRREVAEDWRDGIAQLAGRLLALTEAIDLELSEGDE